MKTISISEAKRHLAKLIDSGETVTITKRRRPVATLSPVRRNPSDVIASILANRCVRATPAEIVALIRSGRR